jgi:hypothetical protein
MNRDRVVEIWWRHGQEIGYGSGYLISDRHILTCDHVIRPKGPHDPHAVKYKFAQYVPKGSIFSIRKPALKVLDADYAWSHRDIDAAVLVATAPVDVSQPLPILRPPVLSADTNAIRIDAGGFPKATETDTITSLCHVRGWASLLEGLRNGRMTVVVDPGVKPTNPKHWKGLSGGPIFFKGHLIGVAASYDDEHDGWKLAGVPMEILAECQGFGAYMPAAGPAPATPIIPIPIDLKGILIPACALDREGHANKFRANVRGAAERPVIKPTAWFWGGHEHHRHDLLIDRFEKFEISEALKDVPGLKKCANTDCVEDAGWPEVDDDGDGLWTIVSEKLRSLLGSKSAKAEEIRAVLNEGIKPRAFSCAIETDRYDDLREELLRRYLVFWNEVAFSDKLCEGREDSQKNTQLPVTLLFYFYGRNEEQAVKAAQEAHDWARKALTNLQVEKLPPFNMVAKKHIDAWLEGPVCRDAPTVVTYLEQLKQHFNTWISEQQLPLGDVYKEIEALAYRK